MLKKWLFTTVCVLAIIGIFCLAIATSALGDTLSFCSPSTIAARQVSTDSWTLNAASPIVAGVSCQTPPPPPPANACIEETPADVPGYVTHCSGYFKLHAGGQDKTYGPAAYSFSFVFGDSWPGDRSNDTMIFTIKNNQVLSIPFKPAPGHTDGFSSNDTWQKHPVTYSISKSPAEFNHGLVGGDVVCATSRTSSGFAVSSNGFTTPCKLDPNTQYWFNVIPATYNPKTGTWVNGWGTTSPTIAINLQRIN